MPVILLSIAMLIISIIFKLAAVFRLTIPLLYVVAMNTFWRSWSARRSKSILLIWTMFHGGVSLNVMRKIWNCCPS